MGETAVIHLMREAMYVTIMISAPILGTAMIVGLIVSILQTTTSIQEQTLTFVPKIVSIFLAIIIFISWMIAVLKEFTAGLFLGIGQI